MTDNHGGWTEDGYWVGDSPAPAEGPPDGLVAKCGGPAICTNCATDAARIQAGSPSAHTQIPSTAPTSGTEAAEIYQPQKPLSTVYASIGNSDDKLSQSAWSNYLHSFRKCMAQFAVQVYGDWTSEPSSSYQNACIAIATETPLTLKAALTSLRDSYRQDSIAWAVVETTEFI